MFVNKGIFRKRPNKSLRFFRSFIILLVIINIISLVPRESDAAPIRTWVSIDQFENHVKSANVRPGENIPVVFFGNITVTKNVRDRFKQIYVSLKVEAPGDGWFASISPPSLIITQLELKTKFQLFVTPPIQALHLSNKVINISGSWQGTPGGQYETTYGEISTESVVVIVSQFFRMNVYEEPVTRIVWPGATVEYDLVIQNSGNGRDEFEISVVNEDSLIKLGFAVELNETRIDILGRSEGRVRVTVHGKKPILEIWRIAMTEIQMKVRSLGAERNNVRYLNGVPKEASFFYYENGPYVSEPVWVLLIILVVIIVFFRYRSRKRSERIMKARKRKKI